MAKKKKYNTGNDITICNNFVGDVIVSVIEDDDSVMIRTEVGGIVMTYVVMSINAAKMLGINVEKSLTIHRTLND